MDEASAGTDSRLVPPVPVAPPPSVEGEGACSACGGTSCRGKCLGCAAGEGGEGARDDAPEVYIVLDKGGQVVGTCRTATHAATITNEGERYLRYLPAIQHGHLRRDLASAQSDLAATREVVEAARKILRVEVWARELCSEPAKVTDAIARQISDTSAESHQALRESLARLDAQTKEGK